MIIFGITFLPAALRMRRVPDSHYELRPDAFQDAEINSKCKAVLKTCLKGMARPEMKVL